MGAEGKERDQNKACRFPQGRDQRATIQRVSGEVQTCNIKSREVEVERRGRRGDKPAGETSTLYGVETDRDFFGV